MSDIIEHNVKLCPGTNPVYGKLPSHLRPIDQFKRGIWCTNTSCPLAGHVKLCYIDKEKNVIVCSCNSIPAEHLLMPYWATRK